MLNTPSGNTLFPVFLKLEKINLLVVGGGNVALEKLEAVLNNCPEAKVKLVGKEIFPHVKTYLDAKRITYYERAFDETDLDDIKLVILAVNDKELSKTIYDYCYARNILTNVADKPDLCDFYLGSIVKKGDLKIAISTNGKSPTIAKRVKDVLMETFPDEIDEILNNMGTIRNTLSGDFAEKVRQLNDLTSVMAIKSKKTNL